MIEKKKEMVSVDNQKLGDLERRVKQNVKDSVFTHLFKNPDYTIQLYRAIHPEDTTSTAADVRILTLENILLNQPYNDLGFSVGDHLLVFVEAQSSWSYNIVVRGLVYMAQTIQEYLMETEQNVYSGKKVKFPFPEFYVIYTGDRKQRPERIVLSEEFFGGRVGAVEVTATMIYDGKQGDIINQYVTFTKVYQQQYQLYGRTPRTIYETIRICKDEDVLREYLMSREKEVTDIMTWLFNQEYATNMYAKELLEEGMEAGRAEERSASENRFRETSQRLFAAGMPPIQIADFVGYSFETVCEWLDIPVTNGSLPS